MKHATFKKDTTKCSSNLTCNVQQHHALLYLSLKHHALLSYLIFLNAKVPRKRVFIRYKSVPLHCLIVLKKTLLVRTTPYD